MRHDEANKTRIILYSTAEEKVLFSLNAIFIEFLIKRPKKYLKLNKANITHSHSPWVHKTREWICKSGIRSVAEGGTWYSVPTTTGNIFTFFSCTSIDNMVHTWKKETFQVIVDNFHRARWCKITFDSFFFFCNIKLHALIWIFN